MRSITEPAEPGPTEAGARVASGAKRRLSSSPRAVRDRQRRARRRWAQRPPPDEAMVELGVPVGPLAGVALAGLPVDQLNHEGLLQAAAACDAQMSWLASMRARFLAEFARRGALGLGEDWCREEVAVACTLDSGEAYRRLATAQALAERLPATGGALAAGTRSWEFAVAVAEATRGLDPERSAAVEAELLADPEVRTSGQAKRAARQRAMAADPELAADRQQGARSTRTLQLWGTPDGSHQGWLSLPDDDARRFSGVIDTLAARQGPDDLRPVGARRADALVELSTFWTEHQDCARCGTGAAGDRPHPPAVTLTVDLPTVLGLAEQPGMLDGSHPVPAETARRLSCDAILTRLVRDPMTGGVVDLGRSARYPSAAQRRRIEHRDQGCRFPTCTRPANRCHAHHIRTWEAGGRTDEDNLLLLCHRHHNAVHEGGWRVQLHADHTVTWTAPANAEHPPELRLPPDGTHDQGRIPEPAPPLYQQWRPPPPRPPRGNEAGPPSALLPSHCWDEPPF